MKFITFIFLALSIILFVFIVTRLFTKGKYLKTEKMETTDISGVFAVTFYGGADPKRVVLFDIEDDGYLFQVEDSEHNFRTVQGISGEEAVREAMDFIKSDRFSMRKILENTRVIGYELRPLYLSTRYGSSDIFDIRYRLFEEIVHVTVDIKSSIRKIYEQEWYGGN